MVELPELRDLILVNNAGLFMLEQIPTCPQLVIYGPDSNIE